MIVLADNAVAASQIDIERARQAKEHLEARMRELKESKTEDVDESMAACIGDLAWCEVQLKVAERRG